MPAPENFAAFILTHKRPNAVKTHAVFRRAGYTGPLYLVVDDEDPTLDEYRAKYGADVLTFSKAEIARRFDEGDNFNKRQSVFYARNACFDLARAVGVRWFIELDDDYIDCWLRFDAAGKYASKRILRMDEVLGATLDWFKTIPALTVAFSQGGDWIGGSESANGASIRLARKAMNTFICDVEKPIEFFGKINEDVNLYTAGSRRGLLCLTVVGVQVNQKTTQGQGGGMTELYLDTGTYVKTFYSVMYCPSAVKVSSMGESAHRIHHSVDWDACAPVILDEKWRKPRTPATGLDTPPARAPRRSRQPRKPSRAA